MKISGVTLIAGILCLLVSGEAFALNGGDSSGKLQFLSFKSNETYNEAGNLERLICNGQSSQQTLSFEGRYGLVDGLDLGIWLPFVSSSYEDDSTPGISRSKLGDAAFFVERFMKPVALKLSLKSPTGYQEQGPYIGNGVVEGAVTLTTQIPTPLSQLKATMDMGYTRALSSSEIYQKGNWSASSNLYLDYYLTDKFFLYGGLGGAKGYIKSAYGIYQDDDWHALKVSGGLKYWLRGHILTEVVFTQGLKGKNTGVGTEISGGISYWVWK